MAPSVETAVDRIARLAGAFFRAPISVITNGTADWIWTITDEKICYNEIRRAASVWTHAAGDRCDLVVPDAALDERFVSGPAGIRFYAGAPLRAAGRRIGSLAILDTEARAPLTEGELSALHDFAALARREMECAARAAEPANVASPETQDWLTLAQKAAGIGFWDWDVVNDHCTCSDQCYRLYGIEPRGSLSYKDWQSLLHPEDRRPEPGSGPQALDFRDPYEAEFRVTWPDGSVHWLLSKGKVYRNQFGALVRMIGANVDVTQLREAEQRRQQAERELTASREQLRQLAARLESAREQERVRIAREIHDELGQMLSVLKIDLGAIATRCRASGSRSLKDLAAPIGSMLRSLDLLIGSSRRISAELRPSVLDHLGIAAALLWQIQDFHTRTGIRCQVSGIPEHLPLDASRSTAVFRIFQEILSNIIRHAGATAVTVEVRQCDGWLTLRVADNGQGFVRERMSDPEALGLLGMRERALLLGGGIEFDSCPGRGTMVTLQIPVAVGEPASAQANVAR